MASMNDPTPVQNNVPPSAGGGTPQAPFRFESKRGPSGIAQVAVDTGRFSRRGTRSALFFIALGLATFFFPIIEFDPPEHGRQYWSVWDVAQRPPAEPKNDSVTGGIFDLTGLAASTASIPFEWVYVFYILLIGALAGVLLLPFRKLLFGIGLTGLGSLLVPFQRTFGLLRVGSPNSFHSSRGGDLRTVWIAFAIEFTILAIIGWTDTNS